MDQQVDQKSGEVSGSDLEVNDQEKKSKEVEQTVDREGEDETVPNGKKKRGRPKGSKNKKRKGKEAGKNDEDDEKNMDSLEKEKSFMDKFLNKGEKEEDGEIQSSTDEESESESEEEPHTITGDVFKPRDKLARTPEKMPTSSKERKNELNEERNEERKRKAEKISASMKFFLNQDGDPETGDSIIESAKEILNNPTKASEGKEAQEKKKEGLNEESDANVSKKGGEEKLASAQKNWEDTINLKLKKLIVSLREEAEYEINKVRSEMNEKIIEMREKMQDELMSERERIKNELRKEFEIMRKEMEKDMQEKYEMRKGEEDNSGKNKKMNEESEEEKEKERDGGTVNTQPNPPPDPLTIGEWKREYQERERRSSNVKVTGLCGTNKPDVTKDFQNVMEKFLGVRPMVKNTLMLKNKEVVFWLYTREAAKSIIKRRRELAGSGVWLEEDSTEREMEVQNWLHREEKRLEGAGIKIKVRHQRVVWDDIVLYWNETQGKLTTEDPFRGMEGGEK